MTRTLLFTLVLILLRTTSTWGQLITEKYPKALFADSFENDEGKWKIMSNADNLFLIQEGKYLLQRKNTKTAYSVFPKWDNTETSFEINATFALESAEGPESGAGLIFMAQSDGTGAFVLEINTKQQYRVKQLVGVNYRLLTGTVKTGGWVTSPNLNGVNQANQLTVRSQERNYDIYINQQYILSFTELAYKTGNTGISAGPSSKFSLDQFSVYGTDKSTSDIPGILSSPSSYTLQPDSHAILIEQLESLKKENKMLRDSLKIMKTDKRSQKPKSIKSDNLITEPVEHPE